jgi:hypothetical protein
MEKAVPERIRLQSGDRGFRVVAFAGEHMVPLKDLVEDDAIHQPSEADPEEESGEAGAGNSLGGCFNVPASFDCGSHSRVAYPQPERLNASRGRANVAPPVRLDRRGRGHPPEDPAGASGVRRNRHRPLSASFVCVDRRFGLA